MGDCRAEQKAVKEVERAEQVNPFHEEVYGRPSRSSSDRKVDKKASISAHKMESKSEMERGERTTGTTVQGDNYGTSKAHPREQSEAPSSASSRAHEAASGAHVTKTGHSKEEGGLEARQKK